MWETWVQSLGQEDPLENRTATHSSILGLPWWFSWERIRLQCRRTQFNSWVGTISWRRDRRLTSVFLGFPGGSDGKESTCNVGDLGSIGKIAWRGNGYPLQNFGLENSMHRGAWRATVHAVSNSRTRLNDFHFPSPITLSLTEFFLL